MKRIAGFTMVEMLAVLAVITILSLMALPSYLDKIVRAQIESSMPLADVAKKPIAEAWKTLHDFPATNTDILLPVADKIVGNYVTSVAVENGAIHMTFGNQSSGAIKGKVLTLRPAVVADEPVVPVAWICGYAQAPNKMTATGKDKTNIPPELLPLECRDLTKKAG
jgi:type IV pilus assembly protein PilA